MPEYQYTRVMGYLKFYGSNLEKYINPVMFQSVYRLILIEIKNPDLSGYKVKNGLKQKIKQP
jgi:hypothetical protein